MTASREVVRADPRMRRLAILAVLGSLVFGIATIGWFLPALTSALLKARASGRVTVPIACYLFLALMVTIGGMVIAFGVYAIRFGRRVSQGALYPPEGARVIMDTRVVRGPLAVRAGKIQVLLGYALFLCATALIVLSVYGVWVILT